MEAYLTKIKELVSQLALASAFIDGEDHVLLILNELPEEYDAFKTTIRARSESISMNELSSLLLSEAMHIESKHHKDHTEPTVAFSYVRGSSNYTYRGFGSRGRSSRGGRGGRSYGSTGSQINHSQIQNFSGLEWNLYINALILYFDLMYSGLKDGWGNNGGLWTVPEYNIRNGCGDGGNNIKVKKEAVFQGGGGEEWKLGKREASVLRYKEKRQNRLFSKRIRYEVRKINAKKRPCMKGRFVKRN
ncbi:zinc finger protein CONSTANS-LIKE 12-like [Camellia sinensis]|uniref:zinc finger protein CONSTANS-LIKE 12-like n=1 Tax=Camellia sinensis TaxID=4442 RepID=UPI0010367F62|nr:zinc finger protein CONSTANS-LIKE 12-like [Camellia sinensis]